MSTAICVTPNGNVNSTIEIPSPSNVLSPPPAGLYVSSVPLTILDTVVEL